GNYLARLCIISYLVTIWYSPVSSLLSTAPVCFEISLLNFSTGVSKATTGYSFSITDSTVWFLISGSDNNLSNKPPSLNDPTIPSPFITGTFSISYFFMIAIASATFCWGEMVTSFFVPRPLTRSLNVFTSKNPLSIIHWSLYIFPTYLLP